MRNLIVWGLVLACAPAAIAAEPQYLLGIAADTSGNIFLADRELPGVWQLSVGKLSLFFQGSKKFRTPLNAVRCLAIDNDGKLLAGDSATRDVFRFGDDKQPVPLTNGEIGIPMSIAVLKSGDLLVADLELHRIVKVPAAGGKPTEFAKIAAPRGLALDKEERLWVVSHGKDALVRFDVDAKPEVVLSGRPFEFASAIVVDDNLTAYVCDTYAKAIWKVPAGKPAEKFVTGEPLVSPVGLTRSGADHLVADPRAKAVIRITPDGKASKVEFTLAGP